MSHHQPTRTTSNSQNLRRTVLTPSHQLVWTVVFLILLGIPLLTTLWLLGTTALIHGPNTIGEAGKVFYAHRFQAEETIFLTGQEPPYYPSVHGPLLHISVGIVGRLLHLSIEDLYYAGRAISVLSTVMALGFCGSMLLQLGARPIWLLAAFAALFCSEGIVKHAISYRPDHWIFFLSTTACWLVVAHGRNRFVLTLLVGIPVLAFFIKPSAVWLLAAIPVGLWIQHRFLVGLIYAFFAALLLTTSILSVQWASQGAFLTGFFGGMKVPFSLANCQVLTDAPYIWVPLLMPLPLAVAIWMDTPNPPTQKKIWVVTAFWIVSLLATVVTLPRSGSNLYYALDSYAFSLMISVAWIANVMSGRWGSSPWHVNAAIGLGLIFVLLNFNPWYNTVFYRQSDPAVWETKRFASDRQSLAQMINDRRIRCFSDDPGLNVLLNQPEVIYTLLPGMMLKTGQLSEAKLLGPVRRREYDLIVLTGRRRQHVDAVDPPMILLKTISRYYRAVRSPNHYHYFVPREDAAS